MFYPFKVMMGSFVRVFSAVGRILLFFTTGLTTTFGFQRMLDTLVSKHLEVFN
ncbi:hypothetical protein [Clostridium bowmanii]|uniref:hypothetical protein n=1 Tax=Clostridium bowmanii TaxID=132925 RepID=UPI001C0B76A7|nr:hypothetical protein [Clostridium bowmanii]MBU3188785.1 hypothetical protein [Clostridium bowmanii]